MFPKAFAVFRTLITSTSCLIMIIDQQLSPGSLFDQYHRCELPRVIMAIIIKGNILGKTPLWPYYAWQQQSHFNRGINFAFTVKHYCPHRTVSSWFICLIILTELRVPRQLSHSEHHLTMGCKSLTWQTPLFRYRERASLNRFTEGQSLSLPFCHCSPSPAAKSPFKGICLAPVMHGKENFPVGLPAHFPWCGMFYKGAILQKTSHLNKKPLEIAVFVS